MSQNQINSTTMDLTPINSNFPAYNQVAGVQETMSDALSTNPEVKKWDQVIGEINPYTKAGGAHYKTIKQKFYNHARLSVLSYFSAISSYVSYYLKESILMVPDINSYFSGFFNLGDLDVVTETIGYSLPKESLYYMTAQDTIDKIEYCLRSCGPYGAYVDKEYVVNHIITAYVKPFIDSLVDYAIDIKESTPFFGNSSVETQIIQRPLDIVTDNSRKSIRKIHYKTKDVCEWIKKSQTTVLKLFKDGSIEATQSPINHQWTTTRDAVQKYIDICAERGIDEGKSLFREDE